MCLSDDVGDASLVYCCAHYWENWETHTDSIGTVALDGMLRATMPQKALHHHHRPPTDPPTHPSRTNHPLTYPLQRHPKEDNAHQTRLGGSAPTSAPDHRSDLVFRLPRAWNPSSDPKWPLGGAITGMPHGRANGQDLP